VRRVFCVPPLSLYYIDVSGGAKGHSYFSRISFTAARCPPICSLKQERSVTVCPLVVPAVTAILLVSTSCTVDFAKCKVNSATGNVTGTIYIVNGRQIPGLMSHKLRTFHFIAISSLKMAAI
jgi:hypothetical protein